MSLDDDQLRRQAQAKIAFGLDVEQWLSGGIGKYLVQRAEDERSSALDALATVDADDTRAIRALQNAVWRAESLQYWLAAAIQDGRNAEQQFVETDD